MMIINCCDQTICNADPGKWIYINCNYQSDATIDCNYGLIKIYNNSTETTTTCPIRAPQSVVLTVSYVAPTSTNRIEEFDEELSKILERLSKRKRFAIDSVKRNENRKISCQIFGPINLHKRARNRLSLRDCDYKRNRGENNNVSKRKN